MTVVYDLAEIDQSDLVGLKDFSLPEPKALTALNEIIYGGEPRLVCGMCKHFDFGRDPKKGWCKKHLTPGFGLGDIATYESKSEDSTICPGYVEDCPF